MDEKKTYTVELTLTMEIEAYDEDEAVEIAYATASIDDLCAYVNDESEN